MVHGRIFCKSSALEREIVMMMMMMNDGHYIYIYVVILSCCKCAYQFCLSTFPTE